MHRLQCFGNVLIRTPDGGEIHLRSRKHLALLLYFVAHPRRALRRDELSRLLWDTEEEAARHSLSQALYDIRKRLKPLDFRTRSGTIQLPEGQIRYDGASLEEAIKSGDLAKVPDLYRGRFAPNLEGVGTPELEDWLESERTRFGTLAQMALRRYAQECDMQGRWGEMCLTALRLVKLDPLDEAAHRALMRALWLHGDQQSALKHFSEIQDFLARELPDGISTETRELVQRIRSSRPPHAWKPEEDGNPPLIGREREFEWLREALRDVQDGRGRTVLVRGEAGIGKTRLLQELARLASMEGVGRLWSRCYAAESDMAYGPIMDGVQPVAERLARADRDEIQRYYQLGHLFPEIFQISGDDDFRGVDPDVRKRRLYEEVVDLLCRACESGPFLWIVEDIQWIDASSASLLHYISRRLADRRCLIVMSARAAEALSGGARLLLETDDNHAHPEVLELGPLSGLDIRRVVQQAGDGPVAMQGLALAERYSGGNPFFALEIARALANPERPITTDLLAQCLSDDLRNLLATRLKGVEPQGIRVLEAIAILERHATPKNIAAVSGLSLRATGAVALELCSRHLILEEQNCYEFSHELMKAFLYNTLGPLRRSAVHLAAGEVLATKPGTNPATLARHYSLAGDKARAFEHAMRAASSSLEGYAYEEAAQMAALAISVTKTNADRHDALSTQAKAQFLSGNRRAAERSYSELVHLSTGPTLYDNLHALVETRISLGKWKEASAAIEQLEISLDNSQHPGRPDEARLRNLVATGKLSMLSRDYDRAKLAYEMIGRELEKHRGSQTFPPEIRATALANQLVYTSLFVSAHSARRLLTETDQEQSLLPHDVRHRLLLATSFVLVRVADWDTARRTLYEALQRCCKVNDVVGQGDVLTNLAVIEIETGNWHEAEKRTNEVFELCKHYQLDYGHDLEAKLNYANLLFYTGRLPEADAVYKDIDKVVDSNDLRLRAEILAGRGLIALQRHDYEASGKFRQELERCDNIGQLGNQEPFKINWFLVFDGQRPLTGRIAALEAAATEYQARDPVSSLKLTALKCFLEEVQLPEGRQEERSASLKRLYANRLGWFVPFGRRWVRTVQRRRVLALRRAGRGFAPHLGQHGDDDAKGFMM